MDRVSSLQRAQRRGNIQTILALLPTVSSRSSSRPEIRATEILLLSIKHISCTELQGLVEYEYQFFGWLEVKNCKLELEK